jgi:Kef-type K+ transport system membrane component KefB
MDFMLDKLSVEFHRPFHNSVLIFAIILAIILLSPLVLRRLKVPGIIVLIISGLFIGPHGFNLIERNSAVELFSTIGLLYIMFLAGLDLELHEFTKNRHKSLLFGFFTFLIPLAIGLPVCYYLLGYGFLTSLLTASMFSTHTLIAYPIVSKLDVTRNEAVAITVGGTIFTDTAVLVILAMITGAAQDGLTSALWLRLGLSFTIFFLIMFFVVPRIALWVFKRLENERYSHYIFVLAIVFFSAYIAELSSLEPIIGAFAAGLVLNKLISKTSPLMNRIEFAGNALFIPFFLISVGMIIDLSSLTHGTQALIVAVALTLVALSAKWIAAWLTAKTLNYSVTQQKLIFGLSSSHAVATIAVIMVGFRIGIIDENILNGTVVLILATCMVATFVTENAARKIALEEELPDKAQLSFTEERILVPIANPQTMNDLIDLTLLFSRPNKNIPVYGLTVVPDDEEASQKLAQSRQTLQRLIHHAAQTDRQVEVISTIDQNVVNGIKRVAKIVGASDIILGTSPRAKLSEYIFGRTIEHLINSTTFLLGIYHPTTNINETRHIQVFVPEYAEKEYGFKTWVSRIAILSKNLSVKCLFHCSHETATAIAHLLKQLRLSTLSEFNCVNGLEELGKGIKEATTSDFLVVIYPRRNTLSYQSSYSGIPRMLDREFSDMSYLLIYPPIKDIQQFDDYATKNEPVIFQAGDY